MRVCNNAFRTRSFLYLVPKTILLIFSLIYKVGYKKFRFSLTLNLGHKGFSWHFH